MSIVSAITNNKAMNSIVNAYRKDPAKAISIAAITSIAVKDGVGCAMYVTQSLHNKKIPDERRKFVAALDLTNGVLMIAAQIGMFFAMKKLNRTLFNKLFSNSFSHKAKKTIVTEYRKLQKDAKVTVSRKGDLYTQLNKNEKKAYDVIDFVTNLAAATIIGKRVIVPFIATPLADKVKKKMDKMDGTTPDTKEEQKQVVTQEAATQSVIGNKLDITSTGSENTSTNLLDKFKQQQNV